MKNSEQLDLSSAKVSPSKGNACSQLLKDTVTLPKHIHTNQTTEYQDITTNQSRMGRHANQIYPLPFGPTFAGPFDVQ